MAEPLPQEQSPKYALGAFGFDFFLLENFKKLSTEYNLGPAPIEAAFDVKTRILFFEPSKVIQSCIYTTVSLTKDNQTICKLSESEIAIDFIIENYEQFKEGENYKFPDTFLKHLNNIAISTSRGLLADKFSCTALQGVVMPLVFSSPEPIMQGKK